LALVGPVIDLGETLIKKIILTSVLISLSLNAYGATSGTTVFSFLKLPSNTRSAALAGMDYYVSSDLPFSSPAFLPRQKKIKVSADYSMLAQELGFGIFSFSNYFGKGSGYSLSLAHLSAQGLTKVVYDPTAASNYKELSSFDFYDAYVQAAYGYATSSEFSFGFALKGINEVIDSNSTYGTSLSGSLFYYPRNRNSQLNFGFSDIGPALKGFDLPSTLYLNYVSQVDEPVWLAAGGAMCVDGNNEAKVSLEIKADDAFWLRGGYRYLFNDNKIDGINGLSAGFGVYIGQVCFDYAWLSNGDLGQTHRLALSFNFGKENMNALKDRKYIAQTRNKRR